jgi:hypothetical protein
MTNKRTGFQSMAPASISQPDQAGQTGDNQYVAALKKLNQRYNPAVLAAIRLLSKEEFATRWKPEIFKYKYSECPLMGGHWLRPGSTAPEHGPVPLGVVLDGIFEVVIRDTWQEKNSPKERLIPIAMLRPGALFGTFEFCDLLASTPSLRDYEVSAGSRAFKIARRDTDALRKFKPKTGAPVGLGKKLQSFKSSVKPNVDAWLNGSEDAQLVRAFELEGGWSAEILLLTQTPVKMRPDERDFLDVVQNAAWQQSRHLREGHLKWLRHDLGPKDLDIRSVTIAAISKFRRKLELATVEECVVFGAAPPPDNEPNSQPLKPYGPIKELLDRINETLFPPKKRSYSSDAAEDTTDAEDQQLEGVSPKDVLVPLFLHDTGGTCYLSLSDDVLVFGRGDDFTEIRTPAQTIADGLPKSADVSYGVSDETVEGGRTDPFWRGTIGLKSKFPEPHCLNIFDGKVDKSLFTNCVIVAAQHLLEETGSLFQTLLRIGGKALAGNIFVVGKPYSSNPRVLHRIRNLGVQVKELVEVWPPGEFEDAWHRACHSLWAQVQEHLKANGHIRKVLILDDGGVLHKTVPAAILKSKRVAGVEQTSKGLKLAGECPFPVIGVACSAAKARLEPSIIAETNWRKLQTVLPQACAAQTMAVCGLGNVGGRLASYIVDKFKQQLRQAGLADRALFLFDRDATKLSSAVGGEWITKATSLISVFQQAEVIFGCAGEDLTADILPEIDAISDGRARYLISCSSFDIEFASLLKKASLSPGITPFDLAYYENKSGTCFLIPQAGFPITFDRAPSAAPMDLIQLTRGLLFVGLVQAAELADGANKDMRRVPLHAGRDPGLPDGANIGNLGQIEVVQAWEQAVFASGEDWISLTRDQCLEWWNPSPGRAHEFVAEHSDWPKIV